VERRPFPPSVPALGLVELDPTVLASVVLEAAGTAMAGGTGPIEAVGITAQRASAIAWDARSGQPIGPGLGWQDLRTAGTCLELQADGIRLSPSESATKWAWLIQQAPPGTSDAIKVGTVDTWIAWTLTEGRSHITDLSNAGVSGLLDVKTAMPRWDTALATRLGVPPSALPDLVDSSGHLAVATALPGAPPICGMAGDQQASLIGQGCTRPGLAKATFGTGAMLDVCTGENPPASAQRGVAGCFPIIAWRRQGRTTWGVEALMLTAGSAVDWLVEDLGILPDAAESATVAAACADTGGVIAVPALLGLATPQWDFGARGTILGLTRGTGRPELVRAVLEGVAHSGADLLEAAETDAATKVERLRIDGGMSANPVFVQALADACARPIEVSPELEATTVGAGYLAGLAIGTWASEDELANAWTPKSVVEPDGTPDRERWRHAVDKAKEWYPELTALQF
jgi:glycerol kinase